MFVFRDLIQIPAHLKRRAVEVSGRANVAAENS
ncbi:hypothetical protein X763_13365 [Mesorhizobium sp. LSHC432A00]|nr:hypothetical protein X763_13365 [Mesorhizobium sp. LSHC432A00]